MSGEPVSDAQAGVRNVRRYSCGLTPRERPKWWRSVAALPKPTSPATQSIEWSVCSSSSWAARTRSPRIQL